MFNSSSMVVRRWWPYVAFCTFRILNVFLIQSQFDPDEYWQQLEPAYCRVFIGTGQPCAGLTWEWKRRPSSLEIHSFFDFVMQGLEGPVRSYASIAPTMLYYQVIKYLGVDTPWAVSRGPVLLNAIIVAATTDWAILYLSRWLQKASKHGEDAIGLWCVYCAMTSWFTAYALTRTYSNSLETALLVISLCLVCPELLGDVQVSYKYRIPRACIAFFLGGLNCSIRFTCLAAFVPMGVLLSLRKSQQVSMSAILSYLIGVCGTFGFLGIFVTFLFDYALYGFPAVPILGNIDFNVIKGNGKLYGTHPFHWYLTAGVPAISGIILPFLVMDLIQMRKWSRARRNLWAICGCYIVAHSFSVHKEFRFLLPILPLFCLLAGERLRDFVLATSWGKHFIVGGALANLLVVMYLGLVHQRAPIEVNRHILETVNGSPQTYRIHYLMGCHSTPLLSHLHSPPTKFETWTLDCSADCRANPNVECESDIFSRDPGQFMEKAYLPCTEAEEDSCLADPQTLYPDFIVAQAGDLPSMHVRLSTMGMIEMGRFMNGINGLSIPGWIPTSPETITDPIYTHIWLLNGQLGISIDEFVLFRLSPMAQ